MKVLVAIDFSDSSNRAFKHALKISKAHPGSTIIAVSIFDKAYHKSHEKQGEAAATDVWRHSHPDDVKEFNDNRKDLLLEKQKELKKECDEFGLKFMGVVEKGDPRELILEIADKENVDAIYTGTRGLNPIIGVQVGSVSDYCVRNAKVPVTVVR